MPTTTNFGWTTPADTDLVKDGAGAIRTLAGNIDTSLVDLKGGTTGQVLSKTSNTDLDFTWVAQDDSNAIQNAIIDAKGDLIAGSAADTPARLAVGTNGYLLTADSSEATGLKWTAPSSGAMTLLSRTTWSDVSSVNVDNVFSSTYENYYVAIEMYSDSNSTVAGRMRLRRSGTTDTGSYYGGLWGMGVSSTTANNVINDGDSYMTLVTGVSDGSDPSVIFLNFYRGTNNTMRWGGTSISKYNNHVRSLAGFQEGYAFDGLNIFANGVNSSGTVTIYGMVKS